MASYQVGFWYTVYGSKTVEANSAEEAENFVKSWLASDGVEGLGEFQTHDQDYGAQDATEIKL